jgi:hypothetical protein
MLQGCYIVVTALCFKCYESLEWNEIFTPNVTNVTGCYKCYSTGLQIRQKSELIRLHRCYKVVT